MSENSPIAEAVDRAINFPLRVGEILAGIVDRENGVGERAIGNLSSFGEAAGVGGVGELPADGRDDRARRGRGAPSGRVVPEPLSLIDPNLEQWSP